MRLGRFIDVTPETVRRGMRHAPRWRSHHDIAALRCSAAETLRNTFAEKVHIRLLIKKAALSGAAFCSLSWTI
jgi:hypothetical protein